MNALFKRAMYFPITKIVIGISVCFSLFIIVQNFVAKPLVYSIIKDRAIADPIIHIVSVFALPISYFFLFRWYDKRKITELSTKYLSKEMFGGFIFGFLTISLSIFILYLLGYYKPISFSTTHYTIKFFTILIIAALVEDLFHRGLIVREIENWLGTNIAIVIGMLIELQHVFNPNSNLFSLCFYLIWGFSMAMLFIYTKRIWLPFFFHIGWNFAQPFYGSNLTGVNDMGSIIQSEFTGPEYLTGGVVGIEGSIFTASFLLFIGITFYYLAKKEGKIVKGKLFTIKNVG